jgi:hypothetical protein
MSGSAESDRTTLVLHLRSSREKARESAVAEATAILRDLGAVPSRGGPLSEARGVAWIALPKENATAARSRLCRLGYSRAVDLVEPVPGDGSEGDTVVRWRGRPVRLVRIYDEPDEALREYAPDRRTFLLECEDGVVRPISGYRGGRGPLQHRALPVVDARLLVNLVSGSRPGVLLDPFAGAGGIIIEARSAGWATLSLDVDRSLRYGLRQLATRHVVGNASRLPIASTSIDAVVTEPPYHPSAADLVLDSLSEIERVLRPGGRAAVLIASDQTEVVSRQGERIGLTLELAANINRKGTAVSCLCWQR